MTRRKSRRRHYKHTKAHPGFSANAAKIARRQGISKKRASAILAAGARKAGAGAVKKNPRLRRVSGVK